MTDYLRFIFNATHLYQPVLPKLHALLVQTGTNQLLDLCSGGSGPLLNIQAGLKNTFHKNVQVILSDKYPNIPAFQLMQAQSQGNITYLRESIDATSVSGSIEGVRTLFSGAHHFHPTMLESVFCNAVSTKKSIAFFDGGDRSVVVMLAMLFIHPILFLLATPFLKPFRFSRLLFTYLIPIIPFCTIWDGIISITRLYTPEQFLSMAKKASTDGYIWEAGKLKTRFGMQISYITGYAKSQ